MDIFGESLSRFFQDGTTYSFRFLLAILIFLIGWVVAKILSKILKQVLITSDIDTRIANFFGLDSALEKGHEAKKQISTVIEKVFYVFLILITLLLSLQMLGDEVVSGILKSILDRIGIAGTDILKAFLIMAFAWAIASVVKFLVIGAVNRLRLWERLGPLFPGDEAKNLENIGEKTGAVLFYTILLLALLPFFEALKMSSLVSPLKGMFDKIFAYIPNILTGAIVVFFGFLLARLVEKLVTGFAESAGVNRYIENLPFETVLKSLDFAKMVGTLAFLVVMVPIVAVAFEAMKITVLTNVLGVFMNRFAVALPNVIAAFFLFILGLIVARFVGDFSTKILGDLGLDNLLSNLGGEKIEKKLARKSGGKFALSRIGGNLIAIVVLLLFLMESLELIHMRLLAESIDKLILYLPNVLIAFVLISLGFYLARVLEDLVRKSFSETRAFEADLIGFGLRYAVIVFSFFMAFDQLKVAHTIVTSAFIILLGTVGLSIALAFGLGGQGMASQYMEHLKEQVKKKKEESNKE